MKFILSLLTLVVSISGGNAQIKVTAGIYNNAFHGRTTASGAKYDKNALTASHRTLPFGTKIRITLADKSVDVTINDRCKVADRTVELSKRAAAEIGLDKRGTAQVEVVILPGTDKRPLAPVVRSASGRKPATTRKRVETSILGDASRMQAGGLYKMQILKLENKGYGVQIAGYSDYETVIKQIAVLQKNWFKGAMVFVDKLNGKPYYKVILGPFFKWAEAESYKTNIRKKYDMKDAFVVDLKALSEKTKAKR